MGLFFFLFIGIRVRQQVKSRGPYSLQVPGWGTLSKGCSEPCSLPQLQCSCLLSLSVLPQTLPCFPGSRATPNGSTGQTAHSEVRGPRWVPLPRGESHFLCSFRKDPGFIRTPSLGVGTWDQMAEHPACLWPHTVPRGC